MKRSRFHTARKSIKIEQPPDCNQESTVEAQNKQHHSQADAQEFVEYSSREIPSEDGAFDVVYFSPTDAKKESPPPQLSGSSSERQTQDKNEKTFQRKNRNSSTQDPTDGRNRPMIRQKYTKNLTQFYTRSVEALQRPLEVSRAKTVLVQRQTPLNDNADNLNEQEQDSNQKGQSKKVPFPKKKWVFCKICRLGSSCTLNVAITAIGLSETMIMKSFKYLDSLNLDETKEFILDQILVYLESEFTKERNKRKKKSKHIETEVKKETKSNIFEVESENHEEELEPDSSKKMCSICYNGVNSDDLWAFSECEHIFCANCIKLYLEDRVMSFKVLDIKCPSTDCDQHFADGQIKCCLDPDLYQKYLRFRNNALLNRNPNLRWCIRPSCEKHMIGQPGHSYLKCECGMEMCFDCCNEYHPGKSCEEMIDRIYQEYAKKVDIQMCPSCKSRVEKETGCNHMKCGMCGNEWCWLCGGRYTRHHYSLLNPFGCSGLQSATHTKTSWPCWKITLWRLLQLLVWILIIFLMPLMLIAALVLVPTALHGQHADDEKKKKPKISICTQALLICIGIIILPVTVFLCLLWMVTRLLSCCCCAGAQSDTKSTKGKQKRSRKYTPQFTSTRIHTRNMSHKKSTNIQMSEESEDENGFDSIPSQNRSIVVNID